MKNFNPFSTGLADMINKSAGKVVKATLETQPFNDFELDVNQRCLTTAKIECQKILDIIDEHERIHQNWVDDNQRKECYKCGGEVTEADGYVGCETCGTDQRNGVSLKDADSANWR